MELLSASLCHYVSMFHSSLTALLSCVSLPLSFFLVNAGKLSSIHSTSIIRQLKEPMSPLSFSSLALLFYPSILYVMRVLSSC